MSAERPPFLPYTRQHLDADDVAAVASALQGERLTQGPAVAEFESALAAACSAKRMLAVSSGTAALHLALMTLDLQPGEAVVVPSVTFVATANAVRLAGGEVIFADVDPDSGLLRVEDLQDALERHPTLPVRAVMPVHLGGQCLAPAALWEAAREHGLQVIEDACHAFGSTYLAGNQRYPVGACAHSDIATFSFHPAKTIATGEGGALATGDPELAARVASLRDHGLIRDPDGFEDRDSALDAGGAANPWYYEQQSLGLNYRASDIHCALGLSQLRKLNRFVAVRRRLVARYDDLLSSLAPLVRPVSRVADCDAAWHLYSVLVDFKTAGIGRASLMRALREQGIGTQVHYIPVHGQPYYRKRYGAQWLPGADAYYERTLSLPLFAAMTEADVDRVVEAQKLLLA